MSHPPDLLRASTNLLTLALGPHGTEASIHELRRPQHSALSTQHSALTWTATVHGIAPLLHARLEQAGLLEQLDAPLAAFLSEQRVRNRKKMNAMLGELAELLQAAAAAGVELLPLKGSALALHYYPAPELRPMADLDLLVRPAQEQAALALLERVGYMHLFRTSKHHVLALPSNNGPVIDYGGEHPNNPRSLELHTSLDERFWGVGYDLTDAAWAACDPSTFAGAPGLLLRPALLLEHLLLHATTDMMARKLRLGRLYDLALVGARLNSTDWERLVSTARSRHEQRMLYAPLLLQQLYLGGVPPGVLAALEQGLPKRLRAYLAGVDAYTVSLCNRTPTSLSAKLSWHRSGPEQLAALRYILIPTPAELSAFYPKLASARLLPLAYLRYALLTASWPLRRALGLRRHGLRKG